MTFRIRIDDLAQREIDSFVKRAVEYDETWMMEQIARLDHVFSVDLAEGPMQRNFFFLTGPPYRGYLFRVGRRTHYWIVYRVDEGTRTVNVLRFWNASRDAERFTVMPPRDKH